MSDEDLIAQTPSSSGVWKSFAEDRWRSSLPAINEAREKVLYSYGLFPYLANLIKACERQDTFQDLPQAVTISPISSSIFETWVRSRARATLVDARLAVSRTVTNILNSDRKTISLKN